jgi:hypothetical protein
VRAISRHSVSNSGTNHDGRHPAVCQRGTIPRPEGGCWCLHDCCQARAGSGRPWTAVLPASMVRPKPPADSEAVNNGAAVATRLCPEGQGRQGPRPPVPQEARTEHDHGHLSAHPAQQVVVSRASVRASSSNFTMIRSPRRRSKWRRGRRHRCRHVQRCTSRVAVDVTGAATCNGVRRLAGGRVGLPGRANDACLHARHRWCGATERPVKGSRARPLQDPPSQRESWRRPGGLSVVGGRTGVR